MYFEILLVVLATAGACAIPGVFLVLRRLSLMSDAISHAILPGIVAAYFVAGSLDSPLLMTGAVATGMITVLLTETVVKSRLVKNDAAIGLIFPALFSVGVVLIAQYAGDVHLDLDAVLLGEAAFAPFDRFEIAGSDLGPASLWSMGAIFVINLLLVFFLFKELKVATFDPGLAASLGFMPVLLHYVLMVDVSLTAVGAFDAVGSILVVALMVVPAACAYLLTDRLSRMIVYALIISILASASGLGMAILMDASIAGGMATMNGLAFLLAFSFAPRRGLFFQIRRKKIQRLEFGSSVLTVHLLHHAGSPEAVVECRVERLRDHINWDERWARSVLGYAIRCGLVVEESGVLKLTFAGERYAREAMERS